MKIFRSDGHLRDEALCALVLNQPLEELERLEIAEHLAFCDLCLQRYTEALTEDTLLAPHQSCHDTIWHRIRSRTLRILSSRYATAAAAVALALVLVWGVPPVETLSRPETNAVSQKLEDWTARLNSSLGDMMDGINHLFDGFGRSDYGGMKR